MLMNSWLLYDLLSKKSIFFRFVILIRGSFGDVLDIENQFYSNEKSNSYIYFFEFKIDVLIEKSILDLKTQKKNMENCHHIIAKRSRLNDNLEIALAIF